MINAFHRSASLRLGCALGLTWPVALYALFMAIAWFPIGADSAAGDLSWVLPAMDTIVAAVATIHALLIAAPQFSKLSIGLRIATLVPVALVVASAVITYVRA